MLGSQQKVIGFFLIPVIVITLDQGFKFMLGNFSNVVKNPGIIFGLFNGFSFYLVIFGLGLLGLLILKNNLSSASAFLLGGAVSNLIDRLRFGYVFDYIDINGLVLGKVHFPVFNLADVAIVVGVVFLVKEILDRN